MELETIRQVLRRRNGLRDDEIDELLADAREEVAEGADPEEVLADHFGLEPDYLFDAEFFPF